MRLAVLLAALLVCGDAVAQERGRVVGVYVPSAPFDGPVARLEFASKLASLAGGGWSGRAFARAGDLAAALKRGDVAFAVIDAPYVAALGVPYQILATAMRRGATRTPWELVAASTKTGGLLDLAGATVAVPMVGARDDVFVTQVLLDGELGKDHFGRIIYAPDALSALAAVGHGRADAAIVPAGLPLPSGVRRVQSLATVSWPVLVAVPGADTGAIAQMTKASLAYSGDVFERFAGGGNEEVRRLAARFVTRVRRGPMATPTLRLPGEALFSGRSFRIARPDVVGYAQD